MADLLDDVKGFLGSLGEDLTRLHVAAVRANTEPADHEALDALVGLPGALIGEVQALLARVDDAREPKAEDAKPASASKPAEPSKRRKSARK